MNSHNLFHWRCSGCKVCEICNSAKKANGDNLLLFCEICDQAYHLSCLNPIMLKVPDCSWICHHCTDCKVSTCKSKLNEISNELNNELDRDCLQKSWGVDIHECYNCKFDSIVKTKNQLDIDNKIKQKELKLMTKEEEKTRLYIKLVLLKEDIISNNERSLMEIEDKAVRYIRDICSVCVKPCITNKVICANCYRYSHFECNEFTKDMVLRESLEGSLCKICVVDPVVICNIESHIGKGMDKFAILSSIAKIQRTRVIHKTQLFHFSTKSKETVISQSLDKNRVNLKAILRCSYLRFLWLMEDNCIRYNDLLKKINHENNNETDTDCDSGSNSNNTSNWIRGRAVRYLTMIKSKHYNIFNEFCYMDLYLYQGLNKDGHEYHIDILTSYASMAAAFLKYTQSDIDERRIFIELLPIVSEILDLYQAGKSIMFSNHIYDLTESNNDRLIEAKKTFQSEYKDCLMLQDLNSINDILLQDLNNFNNSMNEINSSNITSTNIYDTSSTMPFVFSNTISRIPYFYTNYIKSTGSLLSNISI